MIKVIMGSVKTGGETYKAGTPNDIISGLSVEDEADLIKSGVAVRINVPGDDSEGSGDDSEESGDDSEGSGDDSEQPGENPDTVKISFDADSYVKESNTPTQSKTKPAKQPAKRR